jgi:hypothetical protein
MTRTTTGSQKWRSVRIAFHNGCFNETSNVDRGRCGVGRAPELRRYSKPWRSEVQSQGAVGRTKLRPPVEPRVDGVHVTVNAEEQAGAITVNPGRLISSRRRTPSGRELILALQSAPAAHDDYDCRGCSCRSNEDDSS